MMETKRKTTAPSVGDKTMAWSEAYDVDRLVLMIACRSRFPCA